MSAAPPIVITGFAGEQPRVIPRLMPDTAAQAAFDVRLDDGGLTPIRDSAFITNASSPAAKTIYKHKETWLDWNTVVNAAPGPVADDRLYYTGDGKPKVRLESGTVRDLALLGPTVALTAVLGGETPVNTDVTTRVYSYTYVTDIGEESEPSALSNEVAWQPNKSVTLSGFVVPSGAAARGITLQRIYRSQTGQTGTRLHFIAERAVSAANYVDTIPVDFFAEPCPSISWNPPPDDLEGLVTLPNGMMAAYVGKKLYFCEPFHPHAWPEIYILTTDYEIMGLGAMATSLLVTTTGNPYWVTGTHPSTMQQDKIESNFPGINKRSVVDLGYAIAYASNEGLVVAQSNGAIAIATSSVFNREKWRELSPHTMISAQLDSRYIAFYDTVLQDGTPVEGALFLEMPAPTFLVRSGVKADAAVYYISESCMYYKVTGTSEIRRFDAPTALRKSLYWKSKEFVLPYPENYGAFLADSNDAMSPLALAAQEAEVARIIAANQAKIDAGSVLGELAGTYIGEIYFTGDILENIPDTVSMTIGIYADKKKVATVNRSNIPVRLPSGFRGRTWEIEVYTDARIYRMAMTKNMDDLKRQP